MVHTAPLFPYMLLRYPIRYQAILGDSKLSNEQGGKIYGLIIKWDLYTGSDWLVKDGIGAHTYTFTSERQVYQVGGGASYHSRGRRGDGVITSRVRWGHRYSSGYI